MAVCLKCATEMSQTEAICPNCGHDYQDAEESWWDLLLRKSSLRDLFLLTTVIGCPFALWHYFAPAVLGEGNRAPVRSAAGHFLLALGSCSYVASHVLEKPAPLWSKMFAAIGIFALGTWTFWLF